MERIRHTPGSSDRRPESDPAADDWRQRDHIRRLQQSAGNQAVTGMLARRRAERAMLQRYGTNEHTQFGAEDTSVTVARVTMTQGEMIAMADFFADVEQMEDNPRQVEDVLQAIRSGTARTEQWQEATGGRYLELALDNESHFGPPDARLLPQSTGGMTNHYERFAEGHLQALWASATGDPRTAQVHNSFAGHFLTDAFAAGHMINKADLMTHFATRLSDRGVFLDAIAERAWRDDHVREVMSAHERTGLIHPSFDNLLMFGQFLRGVDGERSEVIPNGVALAVHDALNHLADDPLLGGLEVTNDRGDTWRLSGDDTLANSPDSLSIAREAVAQTNTNLAEVVDLGAPAMTAAYREELLARVWAYVPRPTHAGEMQIAEIVERLTNPTDPGLIDTLGAQVAGNIDAIAEAAKRAGRIRVRAVATPP